ncbi:GNAT family N-acetyltransferase [Saccharopolyspora sp. NPDC002686]|uniref:GNAT family N-acetyltransferase n=1 Tax=Saccharopolyspora sp. NPDC002686 TaxID=3154541 RepID=UPI0033177B7D
MPAKDVGRTEVERIASSLVRVEDEHVAGLTAFLQDVDLTLSALDSPDVFLWIDRDGTGRITGSTGFELSADRRHALIRSVAVHPSARRAGYGSALARFALGAAAREGARSAWLFSRRSGPFWQKLGFVHANRDELAAVLPDAHQVRLFVESGQLQREVAWSRRLDHASPHERIGPR